jgi:hypothetical protein
MKNKYSFWSSSFHFLTHVILLTNISISKATNPFAKKDGEISFYLETNHLLFMPAITLDYFKKARDNYGYSISGGVSTIDKKKGYIVPPNIGFPINASFIYGRRDNLIEVGFILRPQFFLIKDYVHHNHHNFEEKLTEDSTITYFTPRIGYRYQEKKLLNLKVSIGPQFSISKSEYVKYTGRIFENYEYLKKIYLQIGVGFRIK